MVKKSSGVAVIERYSNVGLFDNEGPTLVKVYAQTPVYGGAIPSDVAIVLECVDNKVGNIGEEYTISVEGAEVRNGFRTEKLVAESIDGQKFIEMETINISYEIQDSLGNKTTGSLSYQVHNWDVYGTMGGDGLYALQSESSNVSFPKSSTATYGKLTTTSDGKFKEFKAYGVVKDTNSMVGNYIKSGEYVYLCDRELSSSYWGTRIRYREAPLECDYDDHRYVWYDIDESKYPTNGMSGSLWYIKK